MSRLAPLKLVPVLTPGQPYTWFKGKLDANGRFKNTSSSNIVVIGAAFDVNGSPNVPSRTIEFIITNPNDPVDPLAHTDWIDHVSVVLYTNPAGPGATVWVTAAVCHLPRKMLLPPNGEFIVLLDGVGVANFLFSGILCTTLKDALVIL